MDGAQAFGHVLKHCFVAEQVIVLKNHGRLRPQRLNLTAVCPVGVYSQVVEPDGVAVRPFQKVGAAQQRGLARAARPQNNGDGTGFYRAADAFEHLIVPEGLSNVLEF